MPLKIFKKKLHCNYIIHCEILIQNDLLSFTAFFSYHLQNADKVWPVGTILSIPFPECLKHVHCFFVFLPSIIATFSIWPTGSHELPTFFNLLTAVLRFILILSTFYIEVKRIKGLTCSILLANYLADGKQCSLVNLVIPLKHVHQFLFFLITC